MGVKKILGDTFEFIGDTAKPLGQIPGGMFEQAVKGTQLTAQQQQQRQQAKQQGQQQISQIQKDNEVKDEEALQKAREALQGLKRMQATYEAPIRQREEDRVGVQRDNDMIDEQKKKKQQQPAPLGDTGSKQARGMLGGKKKVKANKGFEGMSKDTKAQ